MRAPPRTSERLTVSSMSDMTRIGLFVSGSLAVVATKGGGGAGANELGGVGGGRSLRYARNSCSSLPCPNAMCSASGCWQISSHLIVNLAWKLPSGAVLMCVAAMGPWFRWSCVPFMGLGKSSMKIVLLGRTELQNGWIRDSRLACNCLMSADILFMGDGSTELRVGGSEDG